MMKKSILKMRHLAGEWLRNDEEMSADSLPIHTLSGISKSRQMASELFDCGFTEQAHSLLRLGRAYETLAGYYARLLVDNGFCETIEASLGDANRWLNPKRRLTGSDK